MRVPGGKSVSVGMAIMTASFCVGVLATLALALLLTGWRFRRQTRRELLKSDRAIAWRDIADTPQSGVVVLNRGSQISGFRLWWIPDATAEMVRDRDDADILILWLESEQMVIIDHPFLARFPTSLARLLPQHVTAHCMIEGIAD